MSSQFCLENNLDKSDRCPRVAEGNGFNQQQKIKQTFNMETIKIFHKKRIPPSKVILLKGNANYTELHFESGDVIILAKTLKKLQDSFSSHGFFRISKTNMINLKFLSITNENYSFVKLKNNVELNVSRRRREDLRVFIQNKG